ncbi:MAG: restriction endonuclease subunit S [Cyclobacteriaceae bacterium]
MTTEILNNLDLLLPPLPEQQAIAQILSSLDDKIELNLQMNKTLEEMAMILYKHWFVDFGPFKYGQFIDSALGSIPKGWEVKKMGELVDLKQGLAINKKTSHLLCEKNDDSIPLFKIRDLLQDTVEHYVRRDEVPKQCIADESDLIFSRTGQVGHVFRWKKGCVHNNCFKIIPTKELNKEYLYQFLIDPKFRQFANEIASGSVQKDLNHSTFKNIPFLLPPLELQLKFDEIVSPTIVGINENRKENRTLTALRDTLLPKLISGEVRVKDVEQTVAEAL